MITDKCFSFSLIFLFVVQTYAIARDDKTAKWITSRDEYVNDTNTWIAFRRDFYLKKAVNSSFIKIAVDSKYWMWINDKLVIFEGGLKRGPTPNDSYYDEIDIARYLIKGSNRISILVCFFGKDGFSHKSSGKSGLIIKSDVKAINTNTEWICKVHPAYGKAAPPDPNFRLSESNIRFDANKDFPAWQSGKLLDSYGFKQAIEIGAWGSSPWGNLVKRPIPQWKDFGVKEAPFTRFVGAEKDSIIAMLPYNMQMTPLLEVEDSIGYSLISISTDHSFAGGTYNVRSEYITKRGFNKYESLGWMNGQKIILEIPKNVNVKSVKYRETGYNTSADGSFQCSDDFFNLFWKKGLRTLYVNMRDSYFDCPDRERAQWWGDVVVLMGESFYTYSTSTFSLMKKAILELVNWQKSDRVLFSPVPSGNYDSELPVQMLASIGKYGFWTYYHFTGDVKTIEYAYPAVKKYLQLWNLDSSGLTNIRKGGWSWGDWGDNQDLRLIYAGWHYMALDGASRMADIVGDSQSARHYRTVMQSIKAGFNMCWNGRSYRDPEYHGETDDRVQALAVVSGIADSSKYNAISKVLTQQMHASPYMEKYVMEALCIMNRGVAALKRSKERFSKMVLDTTYTTLFEGWEIGSKKYGGGTVNHAWSGGALTVVAQYLCGIRPLEPGFKSFYISPILGNIDTINISVPTIKGEIISGFKQNAAVISWEIQVPKNSLGLFLLPKELNENNATVHLQDKKLDINWTMIYDELGDKKMGVSLGEGYYKIIIPK